MRSRAELDRYFPPNGPCGFCGDTEIGARHRIIDAIVDAVRAGEPIEVVAEEYDKPVEAVTAALEWSAANA